MASQDSVISRPARPSALEHVGNVPISLILAALDGIDDPFSRAVWRKTMPFSPHRDTDSLILRGPRTSRPRDVLNSLEITDQPEYEIPAIRQAVESVASLADREPARALIASLRPGGKVSEHVDIGKYADSTERYHLALDDTPDAWFRVDGETVRMRPGQVWRIDKHKPHCATNDAESARRHLIVDVWRA